MNQNEVIYQEERRESTNQINNNIDLNYMNQGVSFCPIHGLQHCRSNTNQRIEEQRQISQEENKKEVTQNQHIYHNHEEIDGMNKETNNYKFYESKNIKNNQSNLNSITLHYARGEEKEENKKGNSSYSNIYVSSTPIISDSNYQKYQSFSKVTSSYNNIEGQSQGHCHGFCPIHGNRVIKVQQQAEQ